MAARAAPDTILVSRSPGERRYALLAGEQVIEIVHRRDADMQPGAVYAGRITARVPGVNAVFVEIGDEAPGVLAVKHPPPLGTAVAVTVSVPARGNTSNQKGAELKAADVHIPDNAKVPGLLQAAPEPLAAWLTCYDQGIARIVATPRREAQRLRTLLGPAVPVEDFDGDLFAAEGVDEAVEAGLALVVPLPSGGSLIIEHTAAVVAIDINSGPADPGIANGEAVVAVAAELRRRNIAGHILVDIIPGRRRAAWPRLLAEALSDDPVPARVTGLTPLGMIELTRQRLGLSLREMLCDADGGLSAASVAYKLLRDAVRLVVTEKAAGVAVTAAPGVVALLQGPLRPALEEARNLVKGEIALNVRADFARTRVELRPA